LNKAYEYFSEKFDKHNAGFGNAPKFPIAHNLTFLLRYWKRMGNEKALQMVEKTLKALQLGGIYDHIGFGFHRYSTDAKWLVPHFEKMLYDQAMLVIAYIEAYQAMGKKEYAQTVREILTYVLRDMTDMEGGFFSAEDADSEGEEGKFYLWTEEEIRHILSKDDAEFVKKIFNIEQDGNFIEETNKRKTGKNILYLKKPLTEISSKSLEKIRKKIFLAREKRIHPHKDDKILTDWNGLMIAALARAAQVFNDETYAKAAKKAADFIIENLLDSKGRLYHRYREGEAVISGFLDDYAFFIFGLIELYETVFEVKYLQLAISLSNVIIKHFWDEKQGGFYFTADDFEDDLIRLKMVYDGAYPSGNSIAMLNLIRLARMTGKTEFEKKAVQISRVFHNIVSKSPGGYTQLIIALDFAIGPSYEVVIVGNLKKKDAKNMLNALRKKFIPNKVVIFRPSEEDNPEIIRFAEFTKYFSSKENRATAYVCQNYICKLPTTDIEKMQELLNS